METVKDEEERETTRRKLTFELSSNQRLPPQPPRGGMASNGRERGYYPRESDGVEAASSKEALGVVNGCGGFTA